MKSVGAPSAAGRLAEGRWGRSRALQPLGVVSGALAGDEEQQRDEVRRWHRQRAAGDG